MVRIAIQGINGRMGQVLCGLIGLRKDCTVAAGIDSSSGVASQSNIPVFSSLAEMDVDADVLIDFSHPDATIASLPVCVQKNLPCVICTTGLPEATIKSIHAAAVSVPVFYSANMSLGVNLIVTLAKKAAALLPGFDIEIIEKHHRNKLDAPSGTAMMIADAINDTVGNVYDYQYNRQPLRQARPVNEIGIHAVRGGTIVGEHEIVFAGPDEVISISHAAASRSVFANGAIAAAIFLHGKTAGLYSMEDLIETT